MKIAIYPGSFDPATNGHLDIIERSSRLFDKLIVGVLDNPSKKSLFKINERIEMLHEITQHLPNIEIDYFNGLTVEYAREKEASVIIRGLRAMSDFEYEFQMALTNSKLAPEIEMMFLMTSSKYSFLSSSMVKEIAMFGKNNLQLIDFVPKIIARRTIEKYHLKSNGGEE